MLPKPACSLGFIRKLADFALSTSWPVLRLILSPSAHSLCRSCHWQHVEVHKVHVTRSIKSISYAWTNQVVLFQHWQGHGNHNCADMINREKKKYENSSCLFCRRLTLAHLKLYQIALIEQFGSDQQCDDCALTFEVPATVGLYF